MKASEELRAKIKEFEGWKLYAYRCPAGIPTIGAGHTKGVKMGMAITEAQAEALLSGDLLECEEYVSSLGLELSQGQFDALADFCFNLGIGNLRGSTLLKKIALKRPADEILDEFRRWVYSKEKKLGGLVKRRNWECSMWMTDKPEAWVAYKKNHGIDE